MLTTKELREMCQNSVTLDDIRKLYGVYATLEDVELALPSPMIEDLGILPCSKETLEKSESQVESQQEHKEIPEAELRG
jgi:hypothetical protein